MLITFPNNNVSPIIAHQIRTQRKSLRINERIPPTQRLIIIRPEHRPSLRINNRLHPPAQGLDRPQQQAPHPVRFPPTGQQGERYLVDQDFGADDGGQTGTEIRDLRDQGGVVQPDVWWVDQTGGHRLSVEGAAADEGEGWEEDDASGVLDGVPVGRELWAAENCWNLVWKVRGRGRVRTAGKTQGGHGA